MNSVTAELDGRILVITFDEPGKPVNVLSRAVMEQFSEALRRAETDPAVGAVLIRSGKPAGFIAGADVHEIDAAKSPEELHGLIVSGQQVINRLERLGKPSVAAINGTALGGGLELALAAGYLIAADTPGTRIGLPETKLGLIPGWGGCQRLPRRAGVPKALSMILKGEALSARAARDAGVVDEAVAPHGLERAARDVLEKALAAGGKLPAPPRKRRRTWADWFAALPGFGRSAALSHARDTAKRETRGHYPAADAAIDAIEAGLRGGLERGLAVEAERLSQLAFTPVGRNLRRIFFLSEAAKRKAKGGAAPDLVGVVGAGTMGAGIAGVLAAAGVRVRLRDVSEPALAAGLTKIRKSYDYEIKKKSVTELEAAQRMQRVLPTTGWTGLRNAGIVIEAVVEDMAAKRAVFAELDKAVGDAGVLASNTSALDLDELAAGTSRADRVVGLHFFNPVDRMPLVEVVRGRLTDDRSVAAALAVVKKIGKVPVVVANRPGFVVNRILGPYLVEAGWLLLETGDPRRVDEAARDFGLPMGPAELLDTIGLDVAASVVKTLHAAFGDRLKAPELFGKMIAAGWLGKKSGKGFYLHDAREPTAHPKLNELLRNAAGEEGVKPYRDEPMVFGGPDAPKSAIAGRLVLPMINEAARVLDEGVCASADDFDLAMILGAGFAPFRGGLWTYAETMGLGNAVEQLEVWTREHGPRFEPSEALRRRAEAEHHPAAPPASAPIPEVPAVAAPAPVG